MKYQSLVDEMKNNRLIISDLKDNTLKKSGGVIMQDARMWFK